MRETTEEARARASLNRRNLLRAGLGGAGATVAVTGASAPAVAAENDADKRKARYRETDHVKAYYRTNRY